MVEVLEFLVHEVCLLLHARNLVLARAYVTFELLYLVVKNELKFLQFLATLLKLIDLFFLLAYLPVSVLHFTLLSLFKFVKALVVGLKLLQFDLIYLYFIFLI
jgi:hypothetical protein